MRPPARFLKKDGRAVFLRWGREIHADTAAQARNMALFGMRIHPGLPVLHCYEELERGLLRPLLLQW